MAPKTAWSTTPTLPLVILLAFAASLTVYNLAKAGPQPTTAATIAASPILPPAILLAHSKLGPDTNWIWCYKARHNNNYH